MTYTDKDIEKLLERHYIKQSVYHTPQLIRSQRNFIDMLDGDLAMAVINYLKWEAK